MKLYSFTDAVIPTNVKDFFPGVPVSAWSDYPDEVQPDGQLSEPVNTACYLVVTRRHKVLVDSGIGPVPFKDFLNLKGNFLGKMRRAGFRPEDIDIVYSTHMHFDHIGWNTVLRGNTLTRTFPKAKYMVPKTDWEAVYNPRKVIRQRRPKDISERGVEIMSWVKPLADRMQVFGNMELTVDGQNVTDELKVMSTPGHTPGHQSLILSSMGERLFIGGDVIHLAIQLDVPDRLVAADIHPRLGARVRTKTAKWLEREGILVAALHFPAPGFGRVVRGQGRRYWQPA